MKRLDQLKGSVRQGQGAALAVLCLFQPGDTTLQVDVAPPEINDLAVARTC